MKGRGYRGAWGLLLAAFVLRAAAQCPQKPVRLGTTTWGERVGAVQSRVPTSGAP